MRVHYGRMEQTVNVRLPRPLWEAVKAQAARERRSITAELAVVVERGLGGGSDDKGWKNQ